MCKHEIFHFFCSWKYFFYICHARGGKRKVICDISIFKHHHLLCIKDLFKYMLQKGKVVVGLFFLPSLFLHILRHFSCYFFLFAKHLQNNFYFSVKCFLFLFLKRSSTFCCEFSSFYVGTFCLNQKQTWEILIFFYLPFSQWHLGLWTFAWNFWIYFSLFKASSTTTFNGFTYISMGFFYFFCYVFL